MYPEMRWYGSVDALVSAVSPSLSTMCGIDAEIAAREFLDGYCVHCDGVRRLKVDGGAHFGTDVNLREGLVCQACGLNSRTRQLFASVLRQYGRGDHIALLEAFSPFASYVSSVFPLAELSEYHSPSTPGGQISVFSGPDNVSREACHQDMLALSFEDGSLDGIVHNDVLEHVPDAVAGLAECRRVLKPGATALFTMPWFPWLPETLVRGTLDVDGTLHEILPTELHGDGIRPEGIYTFFNFGADFAGFLAASGFDGIEFGLGYDPFSGATTNNYRYGVEFLMLPTLIRATKWT